VINFGTLSKAMEVIGFLLVSLVVVKTPEKTKTAGKTNFNYAGKGSEF
jgi:hypothetical protein